MKTARYRCPNGCKITRALWSVVWHCSIDSFAKLNYEPTSQRKPTAFCFGGDEGYPECPKCEAGLVWVDPNDDGEDE